MPKRLDTLTEPGPAHVEKARRLIASCNVDTESAPAIAEAMGRICSLIIDRLGPVIGARAAHAFLVRAVHVSKPWSKALAACPTGEGDADVARDLLTCLRGADAKEALGAAISVLGGFIYLLKRFIGEALGERLLHDAFPDVNTSDRDGESS